MFVFQLFIFFIYQFQVEYSSRLLYFYLRYSASITSRQERPLSPIGIAPCILPVLPRILTTYTLFRRELRGFGMCSLAEHIAGFNQYYSTFGRSLFFYSKQTKLFLISSLLNRATFSCDVTFSIQLFLAIGQLNNAVCQKEGSFLPTWVLFGSHRISNDFIFYYLITAHPV